MIRGFLGRKIGMTQVFNEAGEAVPVTVIEAGPCVVTQIRTQERDGYDAIQVGFEQTPPRKLSRPQQGHLKEAGAMVRRLREFPSDEPSGQSGQSGTSTYSVGDILKVDMFQVGQKVDVVGKTKGRGFAGVVKRHGFRGGPKTHGQSDRHRAPGSIGGGTAPSKVWKGQRMAGRMGNKRQTVQNLEVIEVVPEKNLLLVRGAVPGPNKGLVEIKHAVKAKK
jgi:large subunit ribosomal protein L3